MTECDAWFEVWGYDGFQWEFIADLDTREEAEAFAFGRYEQVRIKKVYGQDGDN